MDSKSEIGVKMVRNKKACAACKYHRKKCSPECPLAPYFPSDTGGEDFQHVVKVFGASNFTKLLLKSAGAEQRSAAETMIMEARARRSDPVHGLGGIAKALSKKLNDLASQLAFVNQQNQFHRHRSGVMQQEHWKVESNEASPSPLRAAVPFSSLQECGSSSFTQNDQFSPYFRTAQVYYDATKPSGSSISANLGDTSMAKVKHHNKESDGLWENSDHFRAGVVFKQSKDAEGLTKTSDQEYKGIVRNYEDYVNLSQEKKNNVKCSMDVEEPDLKNCIYYNEWTAKFNQDGEEAAAEYSHHLKEEPECSVDSTAKGGE